ncbi:MAG: Ig-like domain-containing protein [Lachnospiraceae bacterium]|nr:Ig-like domain-containing protein [Lachnospiraceae bacterium]
MTEDKVYCLSTEEALNADNGFIVDDFKLPANESVKTNTGPDDSRKAVTTAFTADKAGYEGEDSGAAQSWWLRSTGGVSIYAMAAGADGAVDIKSSYHIMSKAVCVRPVLRLNLGSFGALWSNAGTVSSNGDVNEEEPSWEEKTLTGISLSDPPEMSLGEIRTLIPEYSPTDAADQEVTWESDDPDTVSVDASGTVTGLKEGSARITVTASGGLKDSCTVTVTPTLKRPYSTGFVSTWNCIWFGRYWQQTDLRDKGKSIIEDYRAPIKWRILDIDENGVALLLSDDSLERTAFNSEDKNISWDRCTLRSFLNSYGAGENDPGTDYTEAGFFDSAFTEEEADAILTTHLNCDNEIWDRKAGNETDDKVFCLSIEEVTNERYGFNGNDYLDTNRTYTEADATRRSHHGLYYASYYYDYWWLRNCGFSSDYAAYVDHFGMVHTGGCSAANIDDGSGRDPLFRHYLAARPAIRLNLEEHKELWSYAGTVRSDRKKGEVPPPSPITLPEKRTVLAGKTITLTPEIGSEDLSDRTITWKSSDEEVAVVDENGVVEGKKPGVAVITADMGIGNASAACSVSVVEINPPAEGERTIEWDCILFGNYWQETDSDGDGRVTKKDTKDPVKWRVLDVDEDGKALLLSDRLLDITDYNGAEGDGTWETSGLRAFLNDAGGFVTDAFSEEERDALDASPIENKDNPVYCTPGGRPTSDRVFCLSVEEGLKVSFGFAENDLSEPASAKSGYYTLPDDSRKAVITSYTEDKAGSYAGKAGACGYWWLRSPGDNGSDGAYVGSNGSLHTNSSLYYGRVCVRPAVRLDLAENSDLWSKTESVSADKREDTEEDVHVTGVSVSPEKVTLSKDETVTLKAVIIPENASNRNVSWRSEDGSVAAVDDKGKVTGLSPGQTLVTVTAEDGKHSASCRVTVEEDPQEDDPGEEDPQEEQEFELDADEKDLNLTMLPGEVRRLKVNKNGYFIYGIRWTVDSSPEKCVSFKNGVVTAKKAGVSKITASCRDRSLTFTVTVGGNAPKNVSVQSDGKSYKLSAPKQKKLTYGIPGTLTVGLSPAIRSASGLLSCNVLTEGVCTVSGPEYKDSDRKKASFTVTPVDAGATYLIWSLENESGIAVKAVTKIIVKKPQTELKVEEGDKPIILSPGRGVRLKVTGTKGNTDPREPAFSVKGKGIRVSKSGYVSAVLPGSLGVVTVKCCGIQTSVNIMVDAGTGNLLSLKKSSFTVKPPKESSKNPKTVTIKLDSPGKKSEQPLLAWDIAGSHTGLSVNEGVVSVGSTARPGCYIITATPSGEGSPFNPVSCEVIVRQGR